MNNAPQARDFKATAAAALATAHAVLKHWLPDGKRNGPEYVALNPTRNDNKAGSFSINTANGQWCDFATGDAGGDLVSLVAYLDGCKQGEAETRLAEFLEIDSKKRLTHVTAKRYQPMHHSRHSHTRSTASRRQPEHTATTRVSRFSIFAVSTHPTASTYCRAHTTAPHGAGKACQHRDRCTTCATWRHDLTRRCL